MKAFALALTCVIPCLAQPSQAAQRLLNGVVTGSLNGDDGASIAGAYVGLHLLLPFPAGRRRQTEWTALSGADGSYRFEGLTDGQYRLCAQTTQVIWLNPCEWGLQPPLVMLSSAQPGASVTMILNKGAALPIRIDDPAHILSQNEGKTPGAHLLFGVGNDTGVFLPARLVSKDDSGRNHQVVIPFNRAVKLVVSTSFFQLSDGSGLPLPRTGAAIPIIVSSGQAPPTIRLIVTGGSNP